MPPPRFPGRFEGLRQPQDKARHGDTSPADQAEQLVWAVKHLEVSKRETFETIQWIISDEVRDEVSD